MAAASLAAITNCADSQLHALNPETIVSHIETYYHTLLIN